jgi:hypothetical protein
MNKRSSAPARLLAAAALVVAFLVAIAAIGGALGGGGSNGSGGGGQGGQAANGGKAKRNTPATYVVESGDTLTSIAHRNGVSVARIERLNPQVDPQILIAGEELKLR